MEFLSPGVSIEERDTSIPTTQGVSTSNLGIVGFTKRGPTDLATLVTSYEQAVQTFGSLTRSGQVMYQLGAFFQNGGSRAYVVRVTPSDAIAATAKVQSKTTDQQVETGDGTVATFTRTASTSALKDNGGVTPLVASSLSMRWRSAAVSHSAPATVRLGTSKVVIVNGQAGYEGRIDPKATFLAAGATAAGGVYYRSVANNDTDVQVAHTKIGASQTLLVTVVGKRITVRLATDSSSIITSTANQIAAAILASAAASALVTAEAMGAGSGLSLACPVTNLRGMPSLDQSLVGIVPGTVSIAWFGGGIGRTLSFSGETTSPIQTKTNGGGSSATIDLRTGYFSLLCASAETPNGADVSSNPDITITYTPTTAVRSIIDNGAGALTGSAYLTTSGTLGYTDGAYTFTARSGASATGSIGSGGDGVVTVTVDATGTLGNEYTLSVVPGTGASVVLSAILNGTAITVTLATDGSGTLDPSANTATLVAGVIHALTGVSATASGTGATAITAGTSTFTGGVNEARPHNLGAVLATYSINAWDLSLVSKGEWGDDVRLQIAGDPSYYSAATQTYSRFGAVVSLYNEESLAFEAVETFDELVFDDPTSTQFWADVFNELSDYVGVAEPGGNEVPGELNGIARTLALGGGNGLAGSQVFSGTLPNGPVGARSLTITYTDATSVVRTITDNGFGGLSGSIDSTYATVVGGQNPNTFNPTTGLYNFKTLYPVLAGTLVTIAYRSAPVETTHTEQFGDTTKGYTAGSDGTFTTDTYGRNQISEPLTLGPAFRGLYALSRVDDIMQVVVPDFAGDVTVTSDQIDYAEERASSNPAGGDRFNIITVPRGSSAQEAVDWVQNVLNKPTKFAAVYWPWVRVRDPLTNNRLLTIPPLGHVAGIYARTDATKNVGKAPAGSVDGAIRGIAELETKPTKGERDVVYPRRINPLIDTPQTGRCVWGSRTLAANSAWRNINAVRLFMFVGKSIYESTHWIVFENNGAGLWARIKLQLDGFLSALYGDGYFAGASKDQAFQVVVDRTNNTPASIDQGQVVTDVAIAPNKPAEFVRFRLAQLSLSA